MQLTAHQLLSTSSRRRRHDSARVDGGARAQQLQANLFATLGVRQLAAQTRFVAGCTATPQVGIAIIDSGIQPGIDFGSRITAFYDFTHGDIRATPPTDEYGHGTHVAGLAAGNYVGCRADRAPDRAARCSTSKGQGSTDNVIRAIEFAIVNKDLLGIDILNLSLGHPIYEPAATDPLVQAVEHARVRASSSWCPPATSARIRRPDSWVMRGIASPGNAPSAHHGRVRCARSTP